MNYISPRRFRLAARNEGKIKSYESCEDVRAWSHDSQTRNIYLRDWIKCDMPICVVPVCTLNSILSVMTCSSRGRVTPRCHSRCQSKVLLDRLSASCTVIKDCLSNTKEFEKYFREEDIETLHWPCDKCLEILKSIKMFWRIVVDKVLKINLPKSNEFNGPRTCSIRNIAREWQREMVDEAVFIKNNTFLIKHDDISKKGTNWENELEINEEDKYLNNDFRNKTTETDCKFKAMGVQTDGKSIRQKISKCTSASIKIINSEYKPHGDNNNEVIMIYKNNIQNLQHQMNIQKNEVDRLKKENITLNVELQRCRKNGSKNVCPYDSSLKNIDNTVALISSSFNSKENFNFSPAKDIDSEMIITLKNCKNENFRHVSVIKILHKTNELNLSKIHDSYYKTEDPIQILNKVHETFEAMVNREILIASKADKSNQNKNLVIKSSFHNVGESRSTPSCSISSYSITSDLNFESANETNGTSKK